MKLFYISFATDTEFLGATVLESHDELSVLAEATKHNLNPGGQAAILELPYEALLAPDVKIMQGRLVSKEEMLANGAVRHGDMSDDMQTKFENVAVVL
jgi:hypothetical protein